MRRAPLAPVIVLLAACAHRTASGPPPLTIAIFPVQNASGGAAPIHPLTEALDEALAQRGLDVVPRAALDGVLAARRIRFTGGVDRPTANALREELGVGAVLVPVLELHAAESPPKVSMAVRLVSTGERPAVLWADVVSRSGDDDPALLGLGRVKTVAELERKIVARVAASVERWVAGRSNGESCEPGRFGPKRSFRAPVLDDVGRRSIAVLPFVNATRRRAAGDVLAGQFLAQLARSGSFEVLDPGLARTELLSHRIVLDGGVSVANATALLELLDADFVLSGYVEAYEPRAGSAGTPKVEFTAYVMDRRSGELVWSSSSRGGGDDGVYFFGAGRVRTSSALSCRMVHGVVDGIVGQRGQLPAGGQAASRTHATGRSCEGGVSISSAPRSTRRTSS